jgi:serine/threonine protein kinase
MLQAHGQPPYFDEGPMEAMRAITQRPPPRLADFGHSDGKKKKKWSPDFEDFVAQCLLKEPGERPTAKLLLLHPFVASATKAGKKTALHKSLTKRNKIVKQRQKDVGKSDSDHHHSKASRLFHTRGKKGNAKSSEEASKESDTYGEETDDTTDAEHDDSDDEEQVHSGASGPPPQRQAAPPPKQGGSFLDNAKVRALLTFRWHGHL